MKNVLIIFIVTILYGCNSFSSSQSNSKPAFNFLVNHDDSMDFVILSSGSDKLNLPSLSKGVDSFEMRLWFTDEVDDRQNVVIVKKSSEEWLVTETTFWQTVRNDTGSNGIYNFDIDSSKSRKLRPVANEAFIDSLMYYSQGLPTSRDLEGTVSTYREGTRHIIELATKNVYKFIPYNCGTVKREGGIHDFMRRFLKFLSNHLSIDIPPCTK